VKVLHIGKYFPPYRGGMETYLRDLMAAQAQQGLEPAALVHRSKLSITNVEGCYEARGEPLVIIRAAVWARLLFTPISPTFPWLLHKLIKRQKPDVLHIHTPNVSGFWALFLPAARKIPWVVHWHSDVLASRHSPRLRLFYTLYRPFERALLKRAAKIIATSPPYLESSEPLKEFRNKCEVVPLGLDPTRLTNAASKTVYEDTDMLRVLAIGRLTYYKGFEYLIRAVADSKGIELHFVGNGELEKPLRQLVGDLNISSKIIFHGKLPDDAMVAQLIACDCLCLPSTERTEAFGMVLLEAMSVGKATVVSNVPGSGMGWVVQHDCTGLHIAPENPASLTKSLCYLRDHRDRIRTLGGEGRTRFEKLFHIDRSAHSLSLIYSDLIANATTDT